MRTTRRRLLAGTSALAASAALGGRIAPVSAQEPSTIRWWHISIQDDLKAGFQAAADAYVAEHPEVTIEITVLENEAFKTKIATARIEGINTITAIAVSPWNQGTRFCIAEIRGESGVPALSLVVC